MQGGERGGMSVDGWTGGWVAGVRSVRFVNSPGNVQPCPPLPFNTPTHIHPERPLTWSNSSTSPEWWCRLPWRYCPLAPCCCCCC
jgi:hypothetical protein